MQSSAAALSGAGSRAGIKAAAFDLDGTLYPNFRLYARLIPFILREWRLLLAFRKARNVIRAAQERQPDSAQAAQNYYDCQARLTADMLGADPVFIREKIERLIYRGWEPHFTKIKPFPHAEETLEALRKAGFKLGLLSDFPPETKLANMGLGDLWDITLCSEKIGALKPDLRPFTALAAGLGLAPEQILYVGNSRRYDVAGAKRAGMRTALITPFRTGLENKKSARSPDFVFNDYRQLYDYMIN
jgi:putative hydrolase of the HAD superfamily